MTKFILDTDFDYEMLLIGISSHARDYRLCWSINSVMGLQLVRKEKGLILPALKKEPETEYPLFEFDDEDSRIFYSLMPNKINGRYLIPELKHADYLLMLRNNIYIDLHQMLEQVRKSDQVLTAFEVKAGELASRDNLIYF